MKWYSDFYSIENEIRATDTPEGIYSLCGLSKEGKVRAMLTYYSDDDHAPDKQIRIDFGRKGKFEVFLLDKEHDAPLTDRTEDLTFCMKVQTCLYLVEV